MTEAFGHLKAVLIVCNASPVPSLEIDESTCRLRTKGPYNTQFSLIATNSAITLDEREIVREQQSSSRNPDNIGDRSTRRHRWQAARLACRLELSRSEYRSSIHSYAHIESSIDRKQHVSTQSAKSTDTCEAECVEAVL
jgi:hypothetical protein